MQMRITTPSVRGWQSLLVGVVPILIATLGGCEGRPGFAKRTDSPGAGDISAAVRTVIQTGRSLPGPTLSKDDRADLDRLYQGTSHTPIWLTGSGAMRGVGKEALERLLAAGSEGLRPADYGPTILDSLAKEVAEQDAQDPTAVARLDVGLSFAMIR